MKFPTTYDFETKCHQFLHFCPFFSIPNAYHVLSGDQPTDQGLHSTMLLVIACGGTAKWVPFAGGVFVWHLLGELETQKFPRFLSVENACVYTQY